MQSFRVRCCVVGSCVTRALRVVVRDMGNGVDRVESSEYIDLDGARAEQNLPGRSPLIFPYPDRFRDICEASALSTGEHVVCDGCMPLGYIRAFDEHTIEMVVWRRN